MNRTSPKERPPFALPSSSCGSFSLIGAAIGLTVFLVAIFVLASARFTGLGESNAPGVIYSLLIDGVWSAAWTASAIGLGVLVHRYVRRREHALDFFSIGSGVALLLWIDHLLGCLGLLQIAGGIVAWVILVPGIIGCLLPLLRQPRDEPEICGHTFASNLIANLYLIPLAIVAAMYAAAAASAPGYLWESEFGGFDALSYHLQLPREWLAIGRIAPLEHNVYSFLPSYVEAAYYHLAVMRDPFKGAHADGAQAAAISCQYLHAMLTFLAFGAIAQLLQAWTQPETTDTPARNGLLARSITLNCLLIAGLALPWIIVVGTLAYNEMPTILLGAAALFRIIRTYNAPKESHSSPTGTIDLLLIGFILGTACGAKLTSLGFVVVPVMLVFAILRWKTPAIFVQHLWVALGGFVALVPYALRNVIATDFSNPFFPFATSIFGRAHWSTEQIARWTEGHLPSVGGLGARLERLWDMAFVDPQWAGLWYLGIIAGLVAILLRETRHRALIASLMLLAQIIFWLFFTHMQSRFLLPCVLTLILLLALPLLKSIDAEGRLLRRFAPSLAGIVLILIGGFTFANWSTQRSGNPAALIDGMIMYSGAGLHPDEAAVLAQNNPTVWINTQFEARDGAVYLLGDSTPFYLDPSYVYHTTWDASPLGEAVRAHPDDPQEWTTYLRNRFQIRYALINWAELDRLINKDHWYDPDVTIERVQQLRSSAGARLIMQWPNARTGQVVHELIELR